MSEKKVIASISGGKDSLAALVTHIYPQLWEKLATLDRASPVTFKPGYTLADFARRFSIEGQQIKLFEEGL